jgi:Flp pilus assembly pilin Flp
MKEWSVQELFILKNLVVGGVKKFLTSKDEGASMGEYAVLLSVLTVAVIAAVAAMGNKVSNVLVRLTNSIS